MTWMRADTIVEDCLRSSPTNLDGIVDYTLGKQLRHFAIAETDVRAVLQESLMRLVGQGRVRVMFSLYVLR